jgi:hypothetical protein
VTATTQARGRACNNRSKTCFASSRDAMPKDRVVASENAFHTDKKQSLANRDPQREYTLTNSCISMNLYVIALKTLFVLGGVVQTRDFADDCALFHRFVGRLQCRSASNSVPSVFSGGCLCRNVRLLVSTGMPQWSEPDNFKLAAVINSMQPCFEMHRWTHLSACCQHPDCLKTFGLLVEASDALASTL